MASTLKNPRLRHIAGMFLGLIAFGIILVDLPGFGLERNAQLAGAVIALMAIWWISLALPIAVTSLVPIVAFPLLGVMESGQVVKFYANNNIYLFLGGFIIALAIERWNLNRRIALWMMLRMGTRPSLLVLGFLVTSAALSMWISNTATAMMMLPIGMAVVSQIAEADDKLGRRFGPALMLAIAYGASLGGIATPIGTPPNIEFAGQFEQRFPAAPQITFFDWVRVFAPLVCILLPVVWLVLTKIVFRLGRPAASGRTIIEHQYRQLGKLRAAEVRVFALFAATALLWIFRSKITIGPVTIPGWSSLFPRPDMLHDATVAITMAILLFIIPSGRPQETGTADGLGNSFAGAVGHPVAFRRRFCGRRGLFTNRAGPQSGRDIATVAARLGALGHRVDCLSVRDIPDRADFQYRNCCGHDSHYGRHRAGPWDESITADDSRDDFSFLRFHASGGHPAKCNCLRLRADPHGANGPGRADPKPAYCGDHDHVHPLYHAPGLEYVAVVARLGQIRHHGPRSGRTVGQRGNPAEPAVTG
jgi:di/tricarboxylate transporter